MGWNLEREQTPVAALGPGGRLPGPPPGHSPSGAL